MPQWFAFMSLDYLPSSRCCCGCDGLSNDNDDDTADGEGDDNADNADDNDDDNNDNDDDHTSIITNLPSPIFESNAL